MYVALDIGCIECGEVSNVLGVFTIRKAAEAVIEEHRIRQKEDWWGQHSFEIAEVEVLDKEYRVEYRG